MLKMDLREIRMGDMNWINLARDMNHWRVFVNTVMNHCFPKYVRKFLSGGFSERLSFMEIVTWALKISNSLLTAKITK
jgi:hypothetical protein